MPPTIASPTASFLEHTPTDPTQDIADHFVRRLWLPVCIAVVFQISALYNANQDALIIIANGALAVVVAVQVIRATRQWEVAVTVGALCGALSTVGVSLYRLIQSFDLVMIFRLFTDPLFTGIMDGIGAGLFCVLIQLIAPLRKQFNSSTSKKE